MIYCDQCGAPVHGAFCGECGAPVPRAAAASEPTQLSPLETPYPPYGQGQQAQQPPTGAPGHGGPAYSEWDHVDPAPVGPTPPRSGRGVRNGLIAAILIFAVAIGGGLVYIMRQHKGTAEAAATPQASTTPTAMGSDTPTSTDTPSTTDPSTSVSPSSSSSSASSSKTPKPTPGAASPKPRSEKDARHKLNAWANADEARSPVNDKWQVVLGSKYVGIVDTHQQAKPFTARDIWTQFQGYRKKFAAENEKFRVLRSTDYGNQSHLGGKTYYVAMLMFNFDSREAAVGWCEDRFHKTGKALQEDCIEAKYSAPHD